MPQPKQVNGTRYLPSASSFNTRKGMRISTHSMEMVTDFLISQNKQKHIPIAHLRALRKTKLFSYLCNSPVDYVRNYDIFDAN